MSKSFARLADFLLDSYVEAAFMTASELAYNLDLDAATVVRFSQYLGYEGFPKLQREIRQRVKNDLLIRPQEAHEPDSAAGVASNAMREVLVAMDRTRISLDTQSLEKLVEQLGQARRINVVPEGPAQPTAYSLVLFLEQGGFPVYIARAGIADLEWELYPSKQSYMPWPKCFVGVSLIALLVPNKLFPVYPIESNDLLNELESRLYYYPRKVLERRSCGLYDIKRVVTLQVSDGCLRAHPD
jgi:hypothetical protein